MQVLPATNWDLLYNIRNKIIYNNKQQNNYNILCMNAIGKLSFPRTIRSTNRLQSASSEVAEIEMSYCVCSIC